MKANIDIRMKAMESGVSLWRIASRLGLSESTFSRRLRREMSEDERQQIYAAINELSSASIQEV